MSSVSHIGQPRHSLQQRLSVSSRPNDEGPRHLVFHLRGNDKEETVPGPSYPPSPFVQGEGRFSAQAGIQSVPYGQIPEPGCLPHGTGRDCSLFMAWI